MTQPASRRFVTEANVNDLVTEQVTDVLDAAEFTVDPTVTGAAGSAALVQLFKDSPFVQRLKFTIPKGDKGDRGLTPRGAWAAATAYAVDDLVTRNGSTYRRIVAGTTATAPESDATNWQPWVSKGDTGPAPAMSTGTVTAANPGTIPSATVVPNGTGAYKLDFTLPNTAPDRFLVQNGGAYPARPDTNPVVFFGTLNPDTAGAGGSSLMLPGDTWVNNDDPAQGTQTIYGTGSPEGVIGASPGMQYVDNAGTNGAWAWRKRTGTGNTGWVNTENATYPPTVGEAARNLIRDPSSESATISWILGGLGAVGGALALDSTRVWKGARSIRLASGAAGLCGVSFDPNIYTVTAAPGETFTFSAYIRTDAGLVPSIQLQFRDAPSGNIVSGGNFASSPASAGSGVYQRLSVTGTAPTGTTHVVILAGFTATAAAQGGNVDGVMLTRGAKLIDFFDGDDPGCRWTGTPYASDSVKMLPNARNDAIWYTDAPELVRNFHLNPAAAVDLSGWTAKNGTIARDVAVAPPGFQTSVAMTVTSGVTGGDNTSTYDSSYFSRTTPWQTGERIHGMQLVYASAQVTVAAALQIGSSRYFGPTTVIPAGTWTALRVVGGTSLVGGASTFHFLSLREVPAGTVIRVVGGISKDRPLQSLYDGDTPGCRWTGTRGSSESVKVLASPDDYNMLVWLDAGRAQGVGSPEGSVVATVGTRYIDTAATLGAIEWIKASGTGATGWQVVYGDTGWRAITSWDSAGVITGTAIPTGAAPKAATAGAITVRRVNGTVSWRVTGLQLTSTQVSIPTPSGFTVSGRYRAVPVWWQSRSTPTLAQVGASSTFLSGTSGDSSDVNYGIAWDYPTTDPWPTTLPGVAG